MADPGYPRPFGKYVLLRPLARGGMGELHLAASGDIGGYEKICVIKKLLPEHTDPSRAQRFLDEAKVVVRLGHANLVSVFDAGEVGGEFYIAMEFVEGKNLREVWNRCAERQVRFPLDVALFIVREICRGLSYAHDYGQLGLVHRDVSPPNIMLSYFGEVKLTDFGLARSVLKQEKTAPGIVYGRYAYLAPEQARGEEADARTDLYSLGIILWELLTGRQLFPVSASDPVTALAVVRSPNIVPPSRVAGRVPASLDELVLCALHRQRTQRFQTAEEMRRALAEELAKIAPTTDSSRVAELLRELYGDRIDAERAEREALVRVELPKVRAASGPVSTDDDATATLPMHSEPVGEPEEAKPEDRPRGAELEQRVGTIVEGRYRILSLLGEGGMGAVYEAEHMQIGKRFALKILHPLYSRQADLVARFRREARAASTIGHPNIVDVSDFGTTPDGSFYYVMEKLEGTDLGHVLSNVGRLSPARAVAIATQVCRALAAAHDANIIHRDLKPENIFLVSRDGTVDFVKLLDFGIAKGIGTEASTRLTSPGMAIGTPEYMAPEQALGKGGDARSDVYAVGAILYEMLGGAPPHEGENVIEVLTRKASKKPARLRTLRQDVPDALEAVIMRALEANPANRPQSMRQLEYELERCLAGRSQAVTTLLGLRPDAVAQRARHATAPRPSKQPTTPRAADDTTIDPPNPTPSGATIAGVGPRPVAMPERSSLARLAERVHLDRGRRLLRDRIDDLLDWMTSHRALSAAIGAGVLLLLVGTILVARRSRAVAVRPPAPPPVAPKPDPVTEELHAVEEAAKRQHWLAPKGESVYDALRRLEVLAPSDPRVAAARRQVIDLLEKKGADALEGKRYAEASVAYRSLIRIDAKTEANAQGLARALAGQAEAALAAGKREAARHAAREAISLDEGQVLAHEILARLDAERAEREAERERPRKKKRGKRSL